MSLPAPTAPPVHTTSLPPATVPPPAVAPAPAVPPPAPAPAPAPPPAASPPKPQVLSPQLEDEQRLQRQAQTKIDETERLVRQIDRTKLAGEQQQSFQTIQSFVSKAKEALSQRDVQRALTLADKARLLADELSRQTR